jgi:hypothetical protein
MAGAEGGVSLVSSKWSLGDLAELVRASWSLSVSNIRDIIGLLWSSSKNTLRMDLPASESTSYRGLENRFK